MKLPTVFNKYRADIDAELKSVLAERQSPLYDMMRYHLGWLDEKGNAVPNPGGKALRPTLCLLACEAAGGNYRQALPAAAAVELVHNYSLIHDDIQDDDKERRHRPTVWSIWGKPQAINAGTAMRILANLSLERLQKSGAPESKRLRAHRLIDERCISLIEGQYLDISFETRFDITADDYLEMIGKKTAALLSCSLELGAMMGTDDEAVIKGLGRFGWDLGIAFQIRDDILGIWGDEGKTGKPAGGDIRRKKKTFPIMWAFDQAKGDLRTDLLEYYRSGDPTPNGTAQVLRVLEAIDARSRAQKMANYYTEQATAAVKKLPLTASSAGDLQELLHFLAERDF